MKKKNRNPNSKLHDYSKYASKWNGVEIPSDDERYYGIHRDGNRVKIDIKRMKKIGTSGVPTSVLDAASALPRNTTYFLPKRLHRHDYVINQFRDKLAELTASWREYKTAFGAITSPTDIAEQVRLERLHTGLDDNEDATVAGILSGAKRQTTYNKLWISQCAQFIHQMATELDALMLRKCVYLGYARKDVTRGSMRDYLNGTMKGRARIESLKGYDVYAKFFTVWNMLKHNSEDLFEKMQKNYPEMLLTDQYRNGEMSQYYLKIGDDYRRSYRRTCLLHRAAARCHSYHPRNHLNYIVNEEGLFLLQFGVRSKPSFFVAQKPQYLLAMRRKKGVFKHETHDSR